MLAMNNIATGGARFLLQGLLAQLGITAEILDSAPLLREAV